MKRRTVDDYMDKMSDWHEWLDPDVIRKSIKEGFVTIIKEAKAKKYPSLLLNAETADRQVRGIYRFFRFRFVYKHNYYKYAERLSDLAKEEKYAKQLKEKRDAE